MPSWSLSGSGQPSSSSKLVEVLGIVGAAVLDVEEAVAVAIARRLGRHDDAEEDAEVGRADAAHEAGAAAALDEHGGRGPPLEAEQRLERELLGRDVVGQQEPLAEDLGHDLQRLGDREAGRDAPRQAVVDLDVLEHRVARADHVADRRAEADPALQAEVESQLRLDAEVLALIVVAAPGRDARVEQEPQREAVAARQVVRTHEHEARDDPDVSETEARVRAPAFREPRATASPSW